MKKRIIALILLCSMLLTVIAALGLNATAASTLTITSPSNDDHVSKSDPPKLKWNKVSGAAGYRVTVVNVDSGKDLVRNEWTTGKSYNLEDLFDDTIASSEYPLLKIWVGAMASKDDTPALTSLSSDIIYIKACEAPEINVPSASVITAYGANFYITVEKNFGSAVIDAGVYIGTSSNIDNAKKYSAKKYSEQCVISSGTMILKINSLEPDTKYYFWGYAENGVDETIYSRKSFSTKAASGSLSVSTESVNWNDSSDNSETVTVSYTGSYSYGVDYDVSSDVKNSDYDYEWLNVTKSGSNLILKPNRANYAASTRTAYITVTSNGQSKVITVTQEKCSESAPAFKLWQGTPSNIIADGTNFGTFDLPQPVMKVDIVSNNILKVYAQLLSPTGELIGECTNLNKISFDTSSLTAGTYSIKVFASNSATSNDYWSQRSFESMTVYFGVRSNIGGSVDLTYSRFDNMNKDYDYTSSKYYENLKNVKLTGNYAEDMITIAKSQVGYNEASNNRSVYGLFWGNTNTGTDSAAWCAHFVEWCAQLVGIVDNKDSILNSYELFTGAFGSVASPYYMLKDYKFEVWYFYINNNGGVNYSSTSDVSWVTDDNRIHNFTGVTDGSKISEGKKESFTPIQGDLIYFRPSYNSNRWGHVGIVDKVENGYVYFYDGNGQGNGIIISGSNDGVAYRKVSLTNDYITAYARPDYVKASPPSPHTHSYTTMNYTEHPHKEYKVCDCGDIIETGNTVKVTGCTECYPVPETCPHLWSTSYEKDDSDHWISCTICQALQYKSPHTWDSGTVTTPATETTTGIKTYACTVCGYTKEEIIPVIGHIHDWSTVYSANETHHWYTCTGCDEKHDITAHLWHSGIVTKPATKTETGIMSYTCAFCQYVKEEVIPRTGLTLADVNNDGTLDEIDADDILKYITYHEIEVNDEVIDVNGDGEVNIRDAAKLLLYLNGKIDSLD